MSESVMYTVSSGLDAVDFGDAGDAAKHFFAAKAENRPVVIRTITRADGRQSASFVASTSMTSYAGKSTFWKWVSKEACPALFSEYQALCAGGYPAR